MPRQKRLPEWLYEALPYLYLGLGLAVMAGLRNLAGLLSGLVLIATGALVLSLRLQARRRRHLRVANDDDEYRLVGQQSGPRRLVWHTGYECGHPVLDAQHRGLMELGNALLDAIAGGQGKLDIELMLDDLIVDIGYHFRDEEAILARMQHPLLAEHQGLHRELLARAQMLSKRYQQGELKADDLYTFIADDILAQHILKQDRRFFGAGGTA